MGGMNTSIQSVRRPTAPASMDPSYYNYQGPSVGADNPMSPSNLGGQYQPPATQDGTSLNLGSNPNSAMNQYQPSYAPNYGAGLAAPPNLAQASTPQATAQAFNSQQQAYGGQAQGAGYTPAQGYVNTNPNPTGSNPYTAQGWNPSLTGAGLPNTPLGGTYAQVPGTVTQQLLPTIGQLEQTTLQQMQPGTYNTSPAYLAQQAQIIAQGQNEAPWTQGLLGGNPNLSNTQNAAALLGGFNPSAGINPAQYQGPATPGNAPTNAFMAGGQGQGWTQNEGNPNLPMNPVTNLGGSSLPDWTGSSLGNQMQQSNSPLGYTYNQTPNANGVYTTPLGYTQYAGQPQQQPSNNDQALLALIALMQQQQQNSPLYGLLSGALGGL